MRGRTYLFTIVGCLENWKNCALTQQRWMLLKSCQSVEISQNDWISPRRTILIVMSQVFMLIRTGGAMKIHIIFISLVFISTALNAETYMERQLRQLDETADDIQDTLKQQDAELKTSRAEMKKAIVKVSRIKCAKRPILAGSGSSRGNTWVI